MGEILYILEDCLGIVGSLGIMWWMSYKYMMEELVVKGLLIMKKVSSLF